MEKINLRELSTLIIRLVVAATFILAALPKIQAPVEFAAAIRNYQVLPDDWSLWVAICLPWLELVCGVGLVVPLIRRACALSIVALLILFIVLHISALARGLDLSCGCFGLDETEDPSTMIPIIRNLALLFGASIVFLRDRATNRFHTPSII